jgi:5,5'-dehydrodivanillate O-demethylase
MLSVELNEQLTRVGPGTPMGELMRRYWHPVAPAADLSTAWTKRIRLLGENLVLYRDKAGRYGLVDEICPHRRASLFYGIPTAQGIRCPYHGWMFDRAGQCLEQPNEPADSNFKNKIKTTAYPVEELGGMLFAYMGPGPAPLLPRFDGFVVNPAMRMIGRAVIPCNWLQIMENSADPIHTEWLHGHLQEFVEEQRGTKYAISKKHLKIAFNEFEYGLVKRRLLEGQKEDCDDWRVGHPIVFPTMLAVGNGDAKAWRMYAFQIRVPMDDTNTMHFWYTAYVPPPGAKVPARLFESVPTYEVPYRDADGEYILDLIDAQDILAWITQGPIADRSLERLGTTDEGVIHFRRMLRREIEKVQRGLDPMGTVRDPAKNAVIELPVEKDKYHFIDGFASILARTHMRYSPIKNDLLKVFAKSGRPKPGSQAARPKPGPRRAGARLERREGVLEGH